MDAFRPIRPLVFALEPERAHGLAIAALKLGAALRLGSGRPRSCDPRLATRLAGLELPNPIGLAAGFDKDGEVPDAMLGLGFGMVEVGTLTPRPQAGNPRPRLFRLAQDRALINRMGFNNGGQAAALARLAVRPAKGGTAGIVGVNIGANKDSPDRIADYATGVTRMAGVADYLVVNISSPNTPGLRALQGRGPLDELLAAAVAARPAGGPPIFLKVAPDLTPADVDDIAAVALDRRIDGLVIANTTLSRPPLRSRHAGQTGGLSGAPLAPPALAMLRRFRAATGAALPLVAVGGIGSAEDAYARIRAGASAVQLYSALVYEGPGLARRMAAGLARLLARDGFGGVAEAVGTERVPARAG